MEMLNQGLSPAHKRMIFEELFQVQVGVGMVRDRRSRVLKERRLRLGEEIRRAIKKILPFHPTGAQKRVLREIHARSSTNLMSKGTVALTRDAAAELNKLAKTLGLELKFTSGQPRPIHPVG